MHLPADAEALLGLAVQALTPLAGEIEVLGTPPLRDDAQLGTRTAPPEHRLAAWLYADRRRTAYAVHLPDWHPDTDDPVEGWTALLRDHLHMAGVWTAVNVLTMPLRPPFDEAGLRVRPLLVLGAAVSPDGRSWLAETKCAALRGGAPHVTNVNILSATLFRHAHPEVGPLPAERIPGDLARSGW